MDLHASDGRCYYCAADVELLDALLEQPWPAPQVDWDSPRAACPSPRVDVIDPLWSDGAA